MANPYLIPCLVRLRSEFNTEAPNRDKGADGWIGDVNHQGKVSDHNPDSEGRVLAIDIDSTGPWPAGFTLDTYVNYIIEECQNGAEYRIEYIIRNRKIYERKHGYQPRDYTGNDPHTNHAHFSARHDHTGQNDTGEWFMLSQTDKNWIIGQFDDIANAVWNHMEEDPQSTATPPGKGRMGGWARMEKARRDGQYEDLKNRLTAIETKLGA